MLGLGLSSASVYETELGESFLAVGPVLFSLPGCGLKRKHSFKNKFHTHIISSLVSDYFYQTTAEKNRIHI
jgi:hypothetical protein